MHARTSTILRSSSAALALALAAGCASTPAPTAARYAPTQIGGEQTEQPGTPRIINTHTNDAYDLNEQPPHPTRMGTNAPARFGFPDASNPSPQPNGYGSIPAENPQVPAVDGMENFSQLTFAADGSDFDPKLSRDGKWLVFASTQHRPTPDIYIKGVSSRTVTQLTSDPASDVMPVLSPDASRIAFASNRAGGVWNLYVMSVKGGQAVQLSTSSAHELHPSWSPDGKRLAFCRLGQMSGRWELWVMDVSQPQAAEFIGYGLFPEWAPVAGTGTDSTDKILFQRGRERGDRAYSLWTLDYKPGLAENFTEVATHRGLATTNATWSPDGQWIVYSTSAPGLSPIGGKSGPSDLWVASIDGASRAALTGGRFANALPTWGADNRIYFVSDRGGIENVWSIAADRALAAAGVTPRQPVANAETTETAE
ncbi:MAG: TolB family protein [Phycisphaerales bacterium]